MTHLASGNLIKLVLVTELLVSTADLLGHVVQLALQKVTIFMLLISLTLYTMGTVLSQSTYVLVVHKYYFLA